MKNFKNTVLGIEASKKFGASWQNDFDEAFYTECHDDFNTGEGFEEARDEACECFIKESWDNEANFQDCFIKAIGRGQK